MRVILSVLCALIGISGLVGAQSINVSPSTLVALASPEHSIVEPHLAIDPIHVDHFLAAAFLTAKPGLKYPDGQEHQTCAAFLWVDSGTTWTRHDFEATSCADPRVAITPDGQALVTMVAKHTTFPQQGTVASLAFIRTMVGVPEIVCPSDSAEATTTQPWRWTSRANHGGAGSIYRRTAVGVRMMVTSGTGCIWLARETAARPSTIRRT